MAHAEPRKSRAVARAALPIVVAVALLPACRGAPTDRPAGANAPPSQVNAGAVYRKAYGGFELGTVVGGADYDPQTGSARLDLLRSGQPVVLLAQRAAPDSVRIAPAAPGYALFVESPGINGTGQLRLNLLDGTASVAVPQGDGVPAGGAFFGENGGQLLFVAGYNNETGRGSLKWSDGKTTRPLGEGAAPTSIVLDSARKTAVAGTSVSAAGVGALLAVDMRTGNSTTLTSTAAVLDAYARPLFALSADGSTVAFTDGAGALQKVATAGGAPAAVAAQGKAPGLSADGAVLAFFGARGKLQVAAGAAPVAIADADGVVAPVVSPDKQWVAWLDGSALKGAGYVGTGWHARVTGGAPVKVGDAVTADSLAFAPKTGRLAALASIGDLTGYPTWDGLGQLLYGAPGAALAQHAEKVPSANTVRLPVSERLACMGAFAPDTGTGAVFVTTADGTGQARQLKDKVLKDSLLVAPGFDSMMFLADPDSQPIEGLYRPATLYGSTADGPPKALKQRVIEAKLTREGRALAIVGDGAEAGIWTLPLP